MERGALIAALALTLPLALYGIPYAYASVTSSSYTVYHGLSVPGDFASHEIVAYCNSGDYVTGGGYDISVNHQYIQVLNSEPVTSFGQGWLVTVVNSHGTGFSDGEYAWAVCQTPITVAGIGVPQFGSVYVAIALGAVVYFMLARRFARRPTISAQVKV
jgi:hypothetical protein